MSQLQDLRARMRLDNAQFSRGLRQARSETQTFGRQMASIVRSFAGPLAAAFSFGSIVTGARRGSQEIDQVAKSARALQGSVGGIRATEMAMKEAGVSASVLRAEVQNLNRQVASGRADSALRALGIEARELARLDTDQKLALLADRFKELGLDAGATGALLQQFGIRNRDMTLFMMQGGDAIRRARKDIDEYGLALSEVDTARIEEANDNIARLSIVGQYLRQELALGVTPAIGRFAAKMTESMREGGALRRLIDALVATMTGFRNIVNVAGVAVATFAASRVPMMVAALGAKAGAIAMVRGQMTLMIAQMYAGATAAAVMTTASRTLATAITLAGGPVGVLVGLLGGGVAAMILFRNTTSTAVPILDEAERAIDGINQVLNTSSSTALPEAQRQTLALTNENIRLAKSAYEAAEAELAKARAAAQYAQTELGLQQAFSPTGTPTQAQQDLDRAIARLTEASSQLRAAQLQLQDRVNEGQLKLAQTAGDIADSLNKIDNRVSGSIREAHRGLNDVGGSIRDLKPATDDAAQALERWSNQAAGHFDGLITGGKDLRGVLMSIARQMESRGWQQLFHGIGSGVGIGSGGGGFFRSLFSGFFDSGGRIPRGQFGIAAEKRAEFVNGVLVPGPADIVGGAETARRLGQGTSGTLRVELGDGLKAEWLGEARGQAVQIVRSQTPRMISGAFVRLKEERGFD